MKNLNIHLAELQMKVESGVEPYNLTPQQVKIIREFDKQLRETGILDRTIRPGFKFPDFALPNQYGSMVELGNLLERGPVVMNFFRGIWCPYCNLELQVLQKSLIEFEGAGASLVAISPQVSVMNKRIAHQNGLRFEILSDTGNSLAKKIGISYHLSRELINRVYKSLGAELSVFNGDESWQLPLTSRFVIDIDATVISSNVDVDFRKRPDPRETLAVVKAMTRRTSI